MKAVMFQGWVDPEGRRGGELLEAWPTLPGVAGAVARAGCTVEVVVAARHDEVHEVDGVRYHFVAERPLPSPRRFLGHRAAPHPRRSLRAAARLTPDVVHFHGLSFPFQARALRRLLTRPVILGQDHADRPVAGWRRPIHRWGLAALDAAAFTAPEQAIPFVRAGLLREDLPIYGVPEGSTTFSPGHRQQARAALGITGSPALGWVGNLVSDKDPGTAVEAFRRTRSLLPHATLSMVYRGGDLEPVIRHRVDADPLLRGRVHLVGPLRHADVEVFLRACDLLLAPSLREGSGYALIEALACGTPAVASSIPSHAAILGSSAAGILVPPRDPGAMADALVRVVTHGDAARRGARARFDAALSFGVIGERLSTVYEDLLARCGARSPKPTAPA